MYIQCAEKTNRTNEKNHSCVSGFVTRFATKPLANVRDRRPSGGDDAKRDTHTICNNTHRGNTRFVAQKT